MVQSRSFLGLQSICPFLREVDLDEAPARRAELAFEVAATLPALREVRHQVLAHARLLPFTDEQLSDIETAVGEAMANAILHGSPLGESNRIRVRGGISEEAFHLEIEDEGEGFMPDSIAVPAVEEMRTNGYGLMLMHQSMDEVGFLSLPERGTTVYLMKRIASSPRGME